VHRDAARELRLLNLLYPRLDLLGQQQRTG